MPVPSSVLITKDGTDITGNVLFNTARFEAQASGGIGSFSFTVRDPDQTMTFTTGDEIVLTLDGTLYYGGWIMQKGQTFAFPVVDTTVIEDVTARYWTIRGVNYNALFDRLITNNPLDFLTTLPAVPGSSQAGALVTQHANDYLDLPTGFNVTTYVDNVSRVHPENTPWLWTPQGSTWRDQLKRISLFNGAIYYIDANKRLHYHAPERVFAPWGFSDRPNRLSFSLSATTFTGATYGFRELDTTEDITNIVNDIFVWGGSPFVASDDPEIGGTFVAHRENLVSQGQYGVWQGTEVRFGELGDQAEVDARAEVIVPPNDSDHPPGVGTDGLIRNRSKPNWTVKLTWFAHDVPTITSTKRHLIPGEIVTIILYVHGNGAANPLILTLPLRRISISFPSLPSDTGGDEQTFVRFDGDFGLSLDDPYQIWEAIMDKSAQTARTINAAGSPTTGGTPGAVWQGSPDELPNGSRLVFTLSSNGDPIIYAAASSEVYLNGLRLRQGADYAEQPNAGTITLFSPPSTGSTFGVIVRLAG